MNGAITAITKKVSYITPTLGECKRVNAGNSSIFRKGTFIFLPKCECARFAKSFDFRPFAQTGEGRAVLDKGFFPLEKFRNVPPHQTF